MAQLTLKINGYSYVVGCEDGQEQHLMSMASEVEGRVNSIKALGGQSGEGRLLALAALLMADELHDLRVELQTARAAATQATAQVSAHAAPKPAKASGVSAKKMQKLAAQAETLADALERPPGG